MKTFAQTSGGDGYTGSVAALAAWAENDPKAAEAWCQVNATGTNRQAYLTGLTLGAARTDFDRAVGIAASMPVADRQGMAIVLAEETMIQAGRRWHQRDAAAAQAWFGTNAPDLASDIQQAAAAEPSNWFGTGN